VKVLVKLGGTLVDDEAARRIIATQVAALAREHELVVVHGGGKQVTRYLEERGIQSRFVGGLRVSDESVIDAVTQVIAGKVNKQLVAAINAAGKLAVGLSGVDGLLTKAERLNPELGFVGKPSKTDGNLLDLLVEARFLPVVACIAADESGNIYNVNADQMAVSCATGWHAARLIFLTDVPGVRDGNGELVSSITPEVVEQLVGSGVAHGGMQAKLEAAVAALHAGISTVIIASGREPDICSRLLAGEVIGTTLSLNNAA
jgi:acetylglutamate kinase